MNATTYCQGPDIGPLNAYTCSSTAPGPPIVRGSASLLGVTELILAIALVVAIVAGAIWRYWAVDTGHTRFDRKARREAERAQREAQRLAEAHRHDEKMAALEVDRQRELNATVVGYVPPNKVVKP